MKYLDQNGLLYFWQKMKELFAGKVDKVSGKELSSNDYTDADRDKLQALTSYTHPTYSTKPSGLYKVTVDSQGHVSAASLVTKSDITSLGISGESTTVGNASATADGLMSKEDYRKLSGFQDAADYALKEDIVGVYKYRGSKASFDSLPMENNVLGDVWNVETDGKNYAWDGTGWDDLGGTFSIQSVSNVEIDGMMEE